MLDIIVPRSISHPNNITTKALLTIDYSVLNVAACTELVALLLDLQSELASGRQEQDDGAVSRLQIGLYIPNVYKGLIKQIAGKRIGNGVTWQNDQSIGWAAKKRLGKTI